MICRAPTGLAEDSSSVLTQISHQSSALWSRRSHGQRQMEAGRILQEDKVWLRRGLRWATARGRATTGEQVYERWNGATNAERIKLLSGSPRHWWLRPPRLDPRMTHVCDTDGTLTAARYSSSRACPRAYIESIIGGNMFKFLTLEERNRRLEAENNLFRAKNQQLEDALLELAANMYGGLWRNVLYRR